MSKTFGVLVLLFTLCTSAFAANSIVRYRCSNGEETNLVLREVSAGLFRADVTVQSFGDSYPTYHFKNVKEQTGLQDPAAGSPLVFQGEGFELVIENGVKQRPATLRVPAIGLKNEKLICN